MPSRHRNPAAVYRPDPDLHERAKTAVADVGSDMNAHILGFLSWLVGDTDELPPRPASAGQAAVTREATTTAQ
ncbi:hypothetical protein [Streptomyces oceani]|uniref:Uncharacterized protein n=1 Tax=Streptomyces oceani TaxID=1075402 RepID=A0A1E7JW02_9ACTN|nr:hypothetical protein [Streptomyces oceani]OEU95474.1 hypothetical protein AN216_23490 [Streptomyces oceani]